MNTVYRSAPQTNFVYNKPPIHKLIYSFIVHYLFWFRKKNFIQYQLGQYRTVLKYQGRYYRLVRNGSKENEVGVVVATRYKPFGMVYWAGYGNQYMSNDDGLIVGSGYIGPEVTNLPPKWRVVDLPDDFRNDPSPPKVTYE